MNYQVLVWIELTGQAGFEPDVGDWERDCALPFVPSAGMTLNVGGVEGEIENVVWMCDENRFEIKIESGWLWILEDERMEAVGWRSRGFRLQSSDDA